MLTFIFLKFALTTYVKIMANNTGQFLKVEDQGEIRFVQRNEDATLWEISSSMIDRSNSNIRVFGRDALLSVLNGMVNVRPTQNSSMQDFKIVIDDNNNFQIVFNKLNFLDADRDHLFLRNDTSVPLGFTFLVKKFNEKQPKETTDVIENDSLGNTVGKGMAIPVTDHQRAFNLYTLPTLSQETGIDYSNFKKNQDLDPNDLVENPEFLKNPEEFLNNDFSPARAEDLKNKYKSAIYYLNANKNDLNSCVQRNALKRMLEVDRNKNCDEYGCYEDLEETSSE
ncbi:hypothetical protein TUBRATIS_27290 [Tubulinosema ratisbonensis]|uniref:Uncharacterized protein n=1 Tax=Tubulinosema ratisbonensis TaxID=291195 RepID=A0A437AID8_9MICR|nr:hypothetical protein TUBRATIS_27290 [Tubulinosema ratisbonensis]